MDRASSLFRAVEMRSDIFELENNQLVGLLLRLSHHREPWLRSPQSWWPTSRLPLEQFDELVRHLFELYPTPAFFRSCWWHDARAFDWYVHVARGGNIRAAPGLPTKLTRRAAHEIANAPPALTPRQGLRWAQLRGFGADLRLIRAILSVRRLATDFENDELWLPLFAKMARAEWVSTEQVRSLIWYAYHARPSLEGRSICNVGLGAQRCQCARDDRDPPPDSIRVRSPRSDQPRAVARRARDRDDLGRSERARSRIRGVILPCSNNAQL